MSLRAHRPDDRSQPLPDPYAAYGPRARSDEASAPWSTAAVAGCALAFVPLVGSSIAIGLGALGLRETGPGGLRGRAAAWTALAVGLAVTLGSFVGLGLAARDWLLEEDRRLARIERRASERQAELGARDEENAHDRVVPAPLRKEPAPRGPDPNPNDDLGPVPRSTTSTSLGSITFVQLGVDEPSLRAALLRERASARERGESLLVVTTAARCEPCDGVVRSLPDTRMQAALAKVRVVRVDVEVFAEELDALRLQRETMPGFFLVAADGSPTDAIDGGEWGADIPENIAPVLGPFVRGTFTQRKRPFRPSSGDGTFL